MPLDLWFTFAAASLVILAIPGPTVLLVLSYALSQGRRVALASAAGVALGDLLAMSASLAGLGALVAASAAAFTLLKWLGAAYLIWLGLRMIRGARAGATATSRPAEIAPAAVFRHAASVTALNPKPIAFFIAFVPQFIRPEAPLMPQFAILVATFVGLGALNALAWALAASHLRARMGRPVVRAWLGRAGGAMLIVMGLMTASVNRVTN